MIVYLIILPVIESGIFLMNSYENIWELQIGIENSSGIVDIKKEAKYCALGHFCDLKLGKK